MNYQSTLRDNLHTGSICVAQRLSKWFCCKMHTVYPKKYAHSFCFAVLCCGYTLTDFPISIRLTSLALWQSNDCPSASKATLMNMDKYFMWIHYERLHNHNKARHNKTVCIFLGIYCIWESVELHFGSQRSGISIDVLWRICFRHNMHYIYLLNTERSIWLPRRVQRSWNTD